MMANKQGFRWSQFHQIMAASVAVFLAGQGLRERVFGLKAPDQVLSQKKALVAISGPFQHPALIDDFDPFSGQHGQCGSTRLVGW
jgi:hypothetical protein